jgi:ankyrin repeat protein
MDKQDACVICQSALNENAEMKVETLECAHAFHEECIREWSSVDFSTPEFKCPVCRKPTAKMTNVPEARKLGLGEQLLWAVQQGEEKKVHRLLAVPGGIRVNATDRYGRTPLFAAAEGSHASILHMLLDNPRVDVNKAESSLGMTPLHAAVDACRFVDNGSSLVRMLLDSASRVNVNLTDHRGYTPLAYAVQSSACREIERVVSMLLEVPGINVNTTGESGCPPLCDIVTKFGNCLAAALATPNLDVNAVDKKGRTPLVHAIKGAIHVLHLDLLLSAPGVDVNKADLDGKTPLHVAAEEYAGFVQDHWSRRSVGGTLLADPRIDVNVQDAAGNTALACAASKAHVNAAYAVAALLSAPGVDIHIRNKAGETALDVATPSNLCTVLKDYAAC